MEHAAPAVTPLSSETESAQDSDVEDHCLDSRALGSESPTAWRQKKSPTFGPDSGSSCERRGGREETAHAQVALDVKEESSSFDSLQNQNGKVVSVSTSQDAVASKAKEENGSLHLPNRQIHHASDTDLEKAVGEGYAKRIVDEGDEGECRVCHLGFDSETETIVLGCDCKDDLSLAHRHCAEAWFKIKGNRSCEICGATAQNVVGIEDTSFMDNWNGRDATASAMAERRSCWHSQAICNFLLACMVVAFMLPWLFRVTAY
eukprot:c22999_g1_i1 orf=244-1026(+)